MSVLNAKHFYAYACGALWLSLAIVLIGWYSGQPTFSFVSATNGISHLIAASGAIISAILMTVFVRNWFFDATHASQLQRFLFYMVILCMVVVGLIPASAGAMLQIHRIFSYLLSFGMVAILLSYAFARLSTTTTRVYALTSLGIMVAGVIIWSGIVGQSLAIVGFSLFILERTYFTK